MKKIYAVMLALPVCCFIGCNESPPGGPNANKAHTDKTMTEKATEATGIGTAENTFKISLPTFETGLKQGDRKTVKISVHRGKNFDQDIKLEFAKLPTGVTATPIMPTLKSADKEVEVTFEASKDAALGEHTIGVTATPAKDGAATSADMKIEVKKP
jgi:uncharacterized membrane protein